TTAQGGRSAFELLLAALLPAGDVGLLLPVSGDDPPVPVPAPALLVAGVTVVGGVLAARGCDRAPAPRSARCGGCSEQEKQSGARNELPVRASGLHEDVEVRIVVGLHA